MDGWLAAGELDHLRVALGLQQTVEDALDLLQRQAEAGPSVGEAERALHVASRVDLDDAEASVLLVLRAEPAVVGAAAFDLRAERERDGAGLVELGRGQVGLGVAVDERLEAPMLRAALAQVDLAAAQQYVAVHHPPTGWADAAG